MQAIRPRERRTGEAREEQLAFKSMRLIIEDHSPSCNVPYFADRLGISLKYPTDLIGGISGQSARVRLVCCTLFETQKPHRESSTDIKSIVQRINFPDQATLSPFFPTVYGNAPSDYRKRIRF